jgi:DNA (cytosine-5)-methyltransferase 1
MTDQHNTTDEPIDVLNLYAGIGGNRKLWEDVNVTAVEWDEDKADVYRDHFPDDEVIVTDAHEYLLEHFRDYDFIWASPPCPTHSQIRYIDTGEDKQNDVVYPDMNLYQEVILLQKHYTGDYAIENVDPYYEPLIEPQIRQRHAFWSNFHIPKIELESSNIYEGTIEEWQDSLGFDLSKYDLKHKKKVKMLRNCVKPKLGKHVLDAAARGRQQTLSEVTTT